MLNLFPLFGRNRIIKTEHLLALRDYSFTHLAVEYQDYADGILCGCEVWPDESNLHVRPGMVKFNGFISLITEEQVIRFVPADQWCVLKMRMSQFDYPGDFQVHKMELALDTEIGRKANELEVCRFKLRQGSRLRDDYQNLLDFSTEYDTINLLSATWSGQGEVSLAPAVTRYFAEQVLKENASSQADLNLAYLSLYQRGAVPYKILCDYVSRRLDLPEHQVMDHRAIYGYLVDILAELEKSRNQRRKPETKRPRIAVE